MKAACLPAGRKQSQILDCFVVLPMLLAGLLAMTSWQIPYIFASEIIEETGTRVIVREHPKTGKPYVSIVSSQGEIPPDPFTGQKKYSRPDYRLLNPKVKSGTIPYEGPSSDRKKVYIFAASLMTVGTVGGGMVIATAPAATGAVASGGAGAYLAGGTAVVAGSAAATVAVTKADPKKEDYAHQSQSELKKQAEFDTDGVDQAHFN